MYSNRTRENKNWRYSIQLEKEIVCKFIFFVANINKV